MARKKRMTKIYDNVQQIKARKGKRSLWPNEQFYHNFEEGAEILGIGESGQYKLKKGDLVIRSRRGKRLWKKFQY
jgi:3'-phosphoadenosine 5'-phosphosulfate sulfotransferase